jgi:hypothetical protein
MGVLERQRGLAHAPETPHGCLGDGGATVPTKHLVDLLELSSAPDEDAPRR